MSTAKKVSKVSKSAPAQKEEMTINESVKQDAENMYKQLISLLTQSKKEIVDSACEKALSLGKVQDIVNLINKTKTDNHLDVNKIIYGHRIMGCTITSLIEIIGNNFGGPGGSPTDSNSNEKAPKANKTPIGFNQKRVD